MARASNRIDIELYSDTRTKPTQGMRAAMAEAEVGDEQAGEDPTTNALCARVADLLGKEAAVFLPSGTMCNEIALAVHCRPGDAVVADANCHIANFEGGGPAALAGVTALGVDGTRGVFTAEQAAEVLARTDRYAPRPALVAVEQTANLGGGTVWPLAALAAVSDCAQARGLARHMDGARLMNAVVASGTPAADFAATVDSVWLDFSKGLGCPVGAVLAGSRDFIDESWRWKQRIGGAMRQSGVLAAAGLYALENHVARLAEDHANARLFADLIAGIEGIAVEPQHVETNIVYFNVAGTGLSAFEIADRLAARGVRIGPFDAHLMRAVTHLDVDEDGVRTAAEALEGSVQSSSTR